MTSLINQTFEIASPEAEQMWATAGPMPPEAKRRPEHFESIRRSENGLWVIRKAEDFSMAEVAELGHEKHRHFSPEERCDIAKVELGRLQELGLHVISFATAPAQSGDTTVYTVTPWINSRRACTQVLYDRFVRPVLITYYEEASTRPPGEPYLTHDTSLQEQYSTSEATQTGEPFLHDLETVFYQHPSGSGRLAHELRTERA